MIQTDWGGWYPATLDGFAGVHAGETCLIVCNGPSLNELPLDFLEMYPSFGCNTICEWEDFSPTYYVAVDDRVRREFGDCVMRRFRHIPKFIPTPNLDRWKGTMFYRWFHRPGPLWPYAATSLWPSEILSKDGITWSCCPHVMMQLAFFMGFETILIVGMDHSDDYRMHAWGEDEGIIRRPNPRALWEKWERGHMELCKGFAARGVRMINVTPWTEEKALPKGDWRDYYSG